MRVKWEISTKYVTGDMPYYTEIPNDDLAECDTEAEKEELISEYVQEDFEQRVSWMLVT